MPHPLRTRAGLGRFVAHYVEMTLVMYVGMLTLLPVVALLALAGSGWDALGDDAPAAQLALMGASMTGPMVAWMRWRGHGWRPALEMGAAMVVPTALAIGAIATGAAATTHEVMLLEHVGMQVAMLVAMLARPREYTCRMGWRPHRGEGARQAA